MDIILWLFLALFPLVLIHELGHFLIAKLNGVHVEEFGIGFPPRLAKLFRAGETDYTLNLLPLGGFVRLVGEDDPEVPGAFAAKGKAVRAAVLAAGPAANFLLATLIFSGVAMSGLKQALPGLRGVLVAAVEDGMPADEAGIRAGDIIVAVDGEALGAATNETNDELGTPEMQHLTNITDGATGTQLTVTAIRGLERVELTGPLEFVATEPVSEPWWRGGRRVTELSVLAGLEPGDIILENQTEEGAGPVAVRFADEIEVTVTPFFDESLDKGRMGIVISPASLAVKFGLVGSVAKGFELTGLALSSMVGALTGLFSQPDQLKGPVGIAQMSRQSAQGGITSFLGFMALLSLNLGLINLLPIPALDGGRLVFIGLEALRGRRIEPSREQLVHVIGFVVVIGLMLVLTVREVADLIGLHLP
jgi:regulator of sigma E protease